MISSRRPVVIGIADKQPTALRCAMHEAQRAGTSLQVVHAASIPVQSAEFYVGVDVFEDVKAAGQKVLDDARSSSSRRRHRPRRLRAVDGSRHRDARARGC